MNTKRFILWGAMLTLLLAAPSIIGGFLLPAQYGETFLGEFPEKCRRLDEARGKRLIIVGGSGMAFAIDSALLEASFPDYTVVNMGMYADLGTKAPLEIAGRSIRAGDLVLIAPEQQAQALSLWVGGRSALQAMDGHWGLLARLQWADIGKCLAWLPDFALEKWRYVRSGEPPQGEGVYCRASFNAYGDIETDLASANVMPELFDPTMPVSFGPDLMDADFMDALNRFALSAQRKGAEVCYGFCPANRLAVDSQRRPDEFYEFLYEALRFPILGDPENSVMDPLWFFDTNFHLNQSGRTVYTRQLVRDIKAWRGDTSATAIDLPPMPSPAPMPGETLRRDQWAGDRNVTEIEVPPDTIAIEDCAFEGCVRLKTIRLRQPLPSRLIVGDHLLDGTSARILVPKGSLSAYRTDYRFSRYADRVFGVVS